MNRICTCWVIIEHGRAVVLAVNKWDGMTPEQRDQVREELDRKLDFRTLDPGSPHFCAARLRRRQTL